MTFVPIASATTCLLAFGNPPTYQKSQYHHATSSYHHSHVHSFSPYLTKTRLFATEIDAPTTTKYDDLVNWFIATDEQSYISPKLDIRPSTRGGLATGGFGAFASEDLSEGELLLRIPRSCCVTLDDALNDLECGPAFTKLMEQAGPGSETVILAGYLAKEYLLLKEYDRRVKEGASAEDDAVMRRLSKIKFGPYLRTLPWNRGVNAQEHVLFWEGDYVDSLLKGSLAYEDAIDIRSTVSEERRHLTTFSSCYILLFHR